jgi:signal transduction histidine kinase
LKSARRASRTHTRFGGARTRVLAAYLVLLVFSTGVSLVALRQILIARAGERVDDALVQETREFRRLAQDGRDPRTGRPFGENLRAVFDVFLSRNFPSQGETFFTYLGGRPYRASGTGRLVRSQSRRVARLGATRRSAGGELALDDGRRIRYQAVPVTVDGRVRGVFVVAIDLGDELEEVGEALRVAAGVSLVVLLAASALGWVVAGRALAPLRTLRDTAGSISETDLTRRVAVRGSDELADLARTFNAMLDRLEQGFAGQKTFISDAGHELRTPITISRGHLELLGDDPQERRQTVELVIDELDRMSRLVDDLLLLAKAQRPDFLRVEDLDLVVLADELFAKASALAPRRWRLERAGAGHVRADRQRLTQAIMNLSENAVRHTADGDTIGLGAEVVNSHARLWVSDSGPGVEPGERDQIFERFVRGGDANRRGEGTGLGLAIVRAIAEAHGGAVELSSRPGAGSRFTLVIPAEPEVPRR